MSALQVAALVLGILVLVALTCALVLIPVGRRAPGRFATSTGGSS